MLCMPGSVNFTSMLLPCFEELRVNLDLVASNEIPSAQTSAHLRSPYETVDFWILGRISVIPVSSMQRTTFSLMFSLMNLTKWSFRTAKHNLKHFYERIYYSLPSGHNARLLTPQIYRFTGWPIRLITATINSSRSQ